MTHYGQSDTNRERALTIAFTVFGVFSCLLALLKCVSWKRREREDQYSLRVSEIQRERGEKQSDRGREERNKVIERKEKETK